jgi:hypothetical protein
VRVEKEGFEPLVAAGVVVKPAQENLVRLEPRSRQGRLRVTEKQGRVLDVELDGAVVGHTPWEGLVAAGDHAVRVHGFVRLDAEEDAPARGAAETPLDRTEMGSVTSSVAVRLYEASAIALSARDLDAALRVEATPREATIVIDGKEVARGSWEGRLPLGSHALDIAASGFLPSRQQLALMPRRQPQIRVDLSRAPRLGTWGPKRNAAVGAAFALGAAGVTVSAVTGAAALVTVAEVRSRCKYPLCPPSQMAPADRAKTLATASTIGLAAGATALAAGTALVVWYRPYDPPARRDEGPRPKSASSAAFGARGGLGGIEIEGRF